MVLMDAKDIFKGHIEKNEVLIVDKNPSSRNRLLKIMADLGCKRNMIHCTSGIEESQEILKTKTIGIVLSEYLIAGGSGFDLFKLIRSDPTVHPKMCLILVTSNMSQTAVAKAAEEDVDSFIIKPFTLQSIKESLLATVSEKIQPPRYILKVEEGKKLISSNQYDEAIKILKLAQKMHAKPSLALFYIGQAEYLKNLSGQAQGSYQEGLAFSEIHFKCLIGLYDLLIKDERFKDAYEILKKIATYFPANPERLMQVIHLAVKTGNFSDMDFFYQTYISLDDRPKTLTKYIGAGLYVSGKNSLMKSDHLEAIKLFQYISVSCAEFIRILRNVVATLVEHGHVDAAEQFLMKFPADEKNSEDYFVSDFLVTSKKFTDYNFIVKESLVLYNKNIKDFMCMKNMIEAMRLAGYNQDKIHPYLKEMQDLWPERVLA